MAKSSLGNLKRIRNPFLIYSFFILSFFIFLDAVFLFFFLNFILIYLKYARRSFLRIAFSRILILKHAISGDFINSGNSVYRFAYKIVSRCIRALIGLFPAPQLFLPSGAFSNGILATAGFFLSFLDFYFQRFLPLAVFFAFLFVQCVNAAGQPSFIFLALFYLSIQHTHSFSFTSFPSISNQSDERDAREMYRLLSTNRKFDKPVRVLNRLKTTGVIENYA